VTITREAAIAKMKARAAQRPTATLCEAVVMLAGLPRTPETTLTRVVMLDVLCERHPEAEAAAEAWAESDDDSGTAGHDAAILGAALTAIGA
jgi:hypothetical protein